MWMWQHLKHHQNGQRVHNKRNWNGSKGQGIQEQLVYEDINWQIEKPVPDDDEPDQARGS